MQIEPQAFDRVLSSMCTEPHPAARDAAERFLATNPGDPGTYPNVSALEDDAIALLSEIAGLDDPAGYVTSGGTEANIQAVRIARERAESRSPNVVMPESGHFSFQKAADLLGVELRLVPTDERHRADLEAVRASVDDDTALVVGVAGTTEYGRVDPIRNWAKSRGVGRRPAPRRRRLGRLRPPVYRLRLALRPRRGRHDDNRSSQDGTGRGSRGDCSSALPTCSTNSPSTRPTSSRPPRRR